jgi:hypothetical protein
MLATPDNAACNLCLFIIPCEDSTDGNGKFGCATCETDAFVGDVGDIKTMLPRDWQDVKVYYYDIGTFVDDIDRMPGFVVSANAKLEYSDEGVTHIALVEGNVVPEPSDPFYFTAHQIQGNSMMLMWSGTRGVYRLMHCKTCAHTFMKWLEAMQGEWYDAESRGLQSKTNTLN